MIVKVHLAFEIVHINGSMFLKSFISFHNHQGHQDEQIVLDGMKGYH